MSIIGTCGHEVTGTGKDGMGFPIEIKDTDKYGHDCISYCVVCHDCLKWYQKNNLAIKGQKGTRA